MHLLCQTINFKDKEWQLLNVLYIMYFECATNLLNPLCMWPLQLVGARARGLTDMYKHIQMYL